MFRQNGYQQNILRGYKRKFPNKSKFLNICKYYFPKVYLLFIYIQYTNDKANFKKMLARKTGRQVASLTSSASSSSTTSSKSSTDDYDDLLHDEPDEEEERGYQRKRARRTLVDDGDDDDECEASF